MKRWAKWLLFIFSFLAVSAFAGWFIGARRLADHQRELEILKQTASATANQTETAMVEGGQEVRFIMKRRVLENIFAELRGFERISKRGNRIQIEKVAAQFKNGYAELEAEADFRWNIGLYRGPVKARYLVFTELAADGSCVLKFRIADAKPRHRFFAWLAPWIALTLDRRLKLPELHLRLGIEKAIVIPSVEKRVHQQTIGIYFPTRQMRVRVENPRVLMTQEYLALTIENIDFDMPVPDDPPESGAPQPGAPQPGAPQPGAPQPAVTQPTTVVPAISPNHDFQIDVRLSFLNEALARAFLPPDDLLIQAERIPGVYQKRTLGLKSDLNLAAVRGALDIKKSEWEYRDGLLSVALQTDGWFEGRIEGKFLGISVDRPFRAQPQFEDALPVRLENQKDQLAITFEEREVTIYLKVETTLAGKRVAFTYPLKLNPGEMLEPINVSRWFARDIDVPVRMERKAIKQSKRIHLQMNWSVRLPDHGDDYVSMVGVLDFGIETQPDGESPVH